MTPQERLKAGVARALVELERQADASNSALYFDRHHQRPDAPQWVTLDGHVDLWALVAVVLQEPKT